MALIARTARVNFDANSVVYAPQISGNLYAGENIDAGAPCYIAADGLVYMSDATANNIKAHCDGFAPVMRKTGEPLTLYGPGAVFRYSDGLLTPGETYYLAATKGRLDSAATTGDASGIVRAIDTVHIRVLRLK